MVISSFHSCTQTPLKRRGQASLTFIVLLKIKWLTNHYKLFCRFMYWFQTAANESSMHTCKLCEPHAKMNANEGVPIRLCLCLYCMETLRFQKKTTVKLLKQSASYASRKLPMHGWGMTNLKNHLQMRHCLTYNQLFVSNLSNDQSSLDTFFW